MRILVALIGLVGGLLAGLLLLLMNPLVALDRPTELDEDGILMTSFSAPIHRGMDEALWSMLGLADDDPDTALASPAIRNSRIDVAVLDSDDVGSAGLAVKLSAYSEQSDLLRGRLGMSSCWNIIWPGRGSIFLVGQENRWPMLSEAVLSALQGDDSRVDADQYLLTTQWSTSDYQGVIGASGTYEDSSGQFREFALPVDGQVNDPDGLLAIAIRSQ